MNPSCCTVTVLRFQSAGAGLITTSSSSGGSTTYRGMVSLSSSRACSGSMIPRSGTRRASCLRPVPAHPGSEAEHIAARTMRYDLDKGL